MPVKVYNRRRRTRHLEVMETKEARQMLLSIAAGGDGHTAEWIEHAKWQNPEEPNAPAQDVYILHAYNVKGCEFMQVKGTLEFVQNVYMLLAAQNADHVPHQVTGRLLDDTQPPFNTISFRRTQGALK